MPFGFHLAMDTLPSRELPSNGSRSTLAVSGFRLRARLGFSIPTASLWPARHYPRLWIQHSSSERRRDFNPPEQRAAQRTLCPLLTSAARSPWIAPESVSHRDKQQISRGKPNRFQRTTAGFTHRCLDGYGLRYTWQTRPTPYASIRFLFIGSRFCFHASFRRLLAETPLRFAITSPPSGCERDFHPLAVRHARHTSG